MPASELTDEGRIKVTELDARIAAIKVERGKGFYVDAQEMEIALYRDIASYENSTPTVAHLLRTATRELSQCPFA